MDPRTPVRILVRTPVRPPVKPPVRSPNRPHSNHNLSQAPIWSPSDPRQYPCSRLLSCPPLGSPSGPSSELHEPIVRTQAGQLLGPLSEPLSGPHLQNAQSLGSLRGLHDHSGPQRTSQDPQTPLVRLPSGPPSGPPSDPCNFPCQAQTPIKIPFKTPVAAPIMPPL